MNRGLAKKQTILKAIEDNPSTGFLDIHRITGFGHGVISHHLSVLEKEGSVRIAREKQKIWVFESSLDPAEDNLRITLRKETCRKILFYLLEADIASFSQIQEAIKKSQGTTSYTLKKLVKYNVVKIKYGFPKKYVLKDVDQTKKILATLPVSYTDTLKDRFADTFSYL